MHKTAPFHGLVGVVAKPSSSSTFSSPAYFTSSLSSLRVAVTFMSSRPTMYMYMYNVHVHEVVAWLAKGLDSQLSLSWLDAL